MEKRQASREIPHRALSGWGPLVVFTIYLIGIWVLGASLGTQRAPWGFWLFASLSSVVVLVGYVGLFLVNPNESKVLVLFGRYRGTVREEGFYWTNPFTIRKKISLRAHNVASQKIKVNDLVGNPIEIGAVVVTKIEKKSANSRRVVLGWAGPRPEAGPELRLP